MRWLDRRDSVLFQAASARGCPLRFGRLNGWREQIRLQCRRVAHFNLARVDLVCGLVVMVLRVVVGLLAAILVGRVVRLAHLAEVLRVHLRGILVGEFAAVIRGLGLEAAVRGWNVLLLLLHEVLDDPYFFLVVAVL